MKNSSRKTTCETVPPSNTSDMAVDASVNHEARDALSAILRDEAQKMLQAAIHREVED
jgi:hypothetical protein